VPTARHECRDVDRLPAGGVPVSLMDDCRTYYHGDIEYRLGPHFGPVFPDDEDAPDGSSCALAAPRNTPNTVRREKYAEP